MLHLRARIFAPRTKETGKPYRLPSEAEWEYACRAGTTTPFSFGETITGKDANFAMNVGQTTEVGSFPPNSWGLCDMHGNVWEWCSDDMRAYTMAAVTDPRGPTETGAERVLRGGSWGNFALNVRSACRFAYEPGIRGNNFGFRCARVQS